MIYGLRCLMHRATFCGGMNENAPFAELNNKGHTINHILLLRWICLYGNNKGHTINHILLLRWICLYGIVDLYSMAQVDVCLY